MENLPWIPIDGLANMILAGIFYIPALAVSSVFAAFLPPRTFNCFAVRVGSLSIFCASLMFAGAFYSCLWGVTIWGWLYRSSDYCGNDFLPFIPIGQAALDAEFDNDPHGLLHGTTLFELRVAWLAFAVATWITAFFLYHRIAHILLPRSQVSQLDQSPQK
jgi:hypothetical protein